MNLAVFTSMSLRSSQDVSAGIGLRLTQALRLNVTQTDNLNTTHFRVTKSTN
jgi:hypothetical protein